MTYIRLKYVHEFVDRHGKPRHYFRRKGFKQVPLPEPPGSLEFNEAYQSALEGAVRIEIGTNRIAVGSVGALVSAYLNSIGFKNLATETQRSLRNILERFREEHDDKRVATLQREHVQKMVNSKADTPSAARNFLKALRALMTFAVELGIRNDNPTLGVKRPKIKTPGFRTWTEEDIAAFEAKYPVGTQARLAMALMLYTGQRRSDIVNMGRQHVRNGAIEVRQRKTGTTLTIPIHPELEAIIGATPTSQLTFLTTTQGNPFKSAASFGNWFGDCCRIAGLPKGTAAHGFRKAACRQLAEAGCSASEIMAISGHKSLSEVQRYCAAVDQARMARAAQAKASNAFRNKAKTSSGKP
jgi:integrase